MVGTDRRDFQPSEPGHAAVFRVRDPYSRPWLLGVTRSRAAAQGHSPAAAHRPPRTHLAAAPGIQPLLAAAIAAAGTLVIFFVACTANLIMVESAQLGTELEI